MSTPFTGVVQDMDFVSPTALKLLVVNDAGQRVIHTSLSVVRTRRIKVGSLVHLDANGRLRREERVAGDSATLLPKTEP